MDAPPGFQHSLPLLFVTTGQGVLVFRAIRLVEYFLISVLLLAIERKASRACEIACRLRQSGFVPIAGRVGTFRTGSFLPRNLGHNELSSWFGQIGTGLALLLIVSRVVVHPMLRTCWLCTL